MNEQTTMPLQYTYTRARHMGGERARHSHRLSHTALTALNEWFETHRSHPYPTKDEKDAIRLITGLDDRQIDTWFANARRRKMSKTINVVHKDRSTSMSIVAGANEDKNSFIEYPSTRNVHPAVASSRCSIVSAEKKIFHCTFCTSSFTSKYDWTRHESSLHLRLKRFICCPFSPTHTEPTTQLTICSYCGAEDPTLDHIEMHNHSACQIRPPEARIFTRKDHLREHLRAVHECDILPHMTMWILRADHVNSRCGFCGQRFTSWMARNEHIAAHYKQGCQMSLWRGCRGLDSAIAAQVVSAIPPFLIHSEKLSRNLCNAPGRRADPQPHMAHLGISDTKDPNQKWMMLVHELQALVIYYSAQKFMISDKALQDYARHVNYGPMESAASTAADNPEWLDTFKRAYCLDVLPKRMNRQIVNVADDLEVYQDLGLPTPPCVKSQLAISLQIMFMSSGPVQKTDRRFSSIYVLPHMALPFETIAGSWPDAGILGDTVVIRDHVFSGSLRAQINFTFTARTETINTARTETINGNIAAEERQLLR